jgi:glycosyltransferase involved in cell wall biosynthesis
VPSVTWAAVATDNPMGQQRYESEIRKALLNLAEPDLTFRDVRVQAVRNRIHGARRSPVGAYFRAALLPALAIGAATYRTRSLVHRLDLRLPPHPGAEVLTIHDLPPARFPDEGALPRSAAASARRARAVICPSEFAASEVRELLSVEEPHVIPYGLSDDFQDPQPADNASLDRLGVGRRFIVHAAGATLRKNLGELAGAWGKLASAYSDLHLLLCGPPDPRRCAAFSGLPRVTIPGRLAPSTLASMMTRAAAVVVPSTYEGFGLPLLEGMACGAPVVGVRAGALPEVAGDAALLVSPTADAIAQGITRVLNDVALAATLADKGRKRARTFSWESAARAHIAVYRAVLRE